MHFLKADNLFNGEHFLQNDAVLVLNNQNELVEIISENTLDSGKIEKLKGTITPGFINSHCHTELSHFKNKIPQKTGLPGFGKQIIFQRPTFSAEEIKEHTQAADKEMWTNGIVAVGDICNTNDSFENKTQSKLYYHSFIELLGLHPDRAKDVFAAGMILFDELNNIGLAGSLAPHAPYSTSAELISKISKFNVQNNQPGSIHNQECKDEDDFLNGIKNGFTDLYAALQLDLSWFKPPMVSSIEHYKNHILNQKTILVHNTFTKQKDIDLVKDKNIFWCFCPNANLYIEDRLPEMNLFLNQKNNICFGTDSLASNLQLDLVSEVNIISENFNLFKPEDLLRAITGNGSKALGISDKYGSFIPGKNAGLNLIDVNTQKIKFIKKLA